VLEITAETGALETQARVKALPPVTQEPKTEHLIFLISTKQKER
jgi:hypothetical protein